MSNIEQTLTAAMADADRAFNENASNAGRAAAEIARQLILIRAELSALRMAIVQAATWRE